MKNILYIIGAVLVVFFLWHLLGGLLGFVLHFAFRLAIIALFAGAVYVVYKAMKREKLTL